MPVTEYPKVIGEHATIEKVHEGLSLARWGDGEFKIMAGEAQIREPKNPVMGKELRNILSNPHPKLIVAIPVLDPRGPKYQNWLRRAPRIMSFLEPERMYYSSFSTRPDSAAENLRTIAYCQRVVQLWQGKRTVLVSEKDVAIYRLVQYTIGDGEMIWIKCPHEKTYAVIDDIEAMVLHAKPDIALLSCGPAATCLAHRLTRHGLHAVDIGSAGSFILKELYKVDIPMSGKT